MIDLKCSIFFRLIVYRERVMFELLILRLFYLKYSLSVEDVIMKYN